MVAANFGGKHILLIVENNAVPFDRRVWREALALRDADARVTVISPIFGVDRKRYSVIDDIEIFRYKLSFSAGSKFGYVREYFYALVKTYILLHWILFTRPRIHVVHVANPPDIFWPLAIYLKLFGIKFIFDEHDSAPETYLSRFEQEVAEAGLMFKVQRWFQLLSYRFAGAIISTNESYREKTVAVDTAYAEKTFVVRNGPDTRSFNLRPANGVLKRGYKYMAAYIGIMAVQDGLDYIIRAVAELIHNRDFSDLIVYLIGTGDEIRNLQDLAQTLKVDEHVIFTGRIPDEPALEILSTADICLSPDPYNPLNNISTMNKIMEYMALGKPIVSFDLKEAKYSAQDTALYVENNNVGAFADGMVRLFRDRDLARRMGERGRELVEKKLSWQKQIDHLYRVYEHVIT